MNNSILNTNPQLFPHLNLEKLQLTAKQFASKLVPKDVVFLEGPMGIGKTTFSQTVIKTLGSSERVKSPTFSIIENYPLNKKIPAVIHSDFYRLNYQHDPDIEALLIEAWQEGAVLLIEWPQLLSGFSLQPTHQIDFQIESKLGTRHLSWTKFSD